MVHISNSRATIYSQFELDVWGYYANNSPIYNIPKFDTSVTKLFHLLRSERWGLEGRSNRIYIYQVYVHNPRSKRHRSNWRFVFIRMLNYFYMSLSHSQFSSYGRSALSQEGFFVSNYLFFLEGSLASVLYRMKFVSNVFTLSQFITYGHAIVGVRVQTYLNFNVGICEAVRVQPYCRSAVWLALVSRLAENRVYYNTPRYMVINYSLMFGLLYCKPGENDVGFPIGIDVFSGMDHI